MIAAALFAATTIVAVGDPLAVWYIRGDAARTHLTYRIEYREESPGHRRSLDEENTLAPSALGTTIAGITLDQLYSSGTHVRFENRRDAGTISGEGWAAGGNASGNFTMALNPAYAQELQRRGVGAPTADQQTTLLLEDGSYAMLDAFASYGYQRPTVDQFVRALEHGVSMAYLRDMHGAGFNPQSVDVIIRARDHGVSADFVRALRSAGVTGSLDDFITARDHGVSAEDVATLTRAGYTGLSLRELARLRDHGVDPEFVAQLGKLGYAHVAVDDLVRMRDHGVDVAFIERLHSQGYAHLSVDDLVKLKDHGI